MRLILTGLHTTTKGKSQHHYSRSTQGLLTIPRTTLYPTFILPVFENTELGKGGDSTASALKYVPARTLVRHACTYRPYYLCPRDVGENPTLQPKGGVVAISPLAEFLSCRSTLSVPQLVLLLFSSRPRAGPCSSPVLIYFPRPLLLYVIPYLCTAHEESSFVPYT